MSKSPYPLWGKIQKELQGDLTITELRLLVLMGAVTIAFLALVIDNEVGLAALAAYVFLP